MNPRAEVSYNCAPLVLREGHTDDTDKAECFAIEIKNNGILTRDALRPNYASGGESISALELSNSQGNDSELKKNC